MNNSINNLLFQWILMNLFISIFSINSFCHHHLPTAISQNQSLRKTISAILLEEETDIPIYNAFIFVRNSSINTTSDLAGTFQLDVEKLKEFEVVITHLNYKTTSFRISSTQPLKEKIYLKPKKQQFQEVVITSKRLRSKKRKKWLKQFTNAFLGQSKNKVTILNPEVIWFEEKENILAAHAIDYISILNSELGYKLRFYLDDFKLEPDKDVVYSGKVFFEDIIDQTKKSKKVAAKREKTFLLSKRYFFRSLWEEKVDKEQFIYGLVTEDGQEQNFIPAQKTILPIRKTGDYLVIETDDKFAFANKNIVTKWGNNFFTGGQNAYATGVLKPLTGRIVIDSNGEIVNANEVEESDYWAKKRIAKLLPIDYTSSFVIQNNTHNTAAQIDLFTNFFNENLQEKIYLHLNKPYYSLTESIWFKAYLVNSQNHQASLLSKVVYVDLLDPNGQIAKSWTLHTDKVMEGDFRFNNSFQAGTYHIRAYTQFMRNLDPCFFFQKEIQILDYALTQNTSKYDSLALDSGLLKPQLIDIQPHASINFYPEGGYLVEGLAGNISTKVSDNDGKGLALEGLILDEKHQIVSKIKTNEAGLGLFNLIPKKGSVYRAIFEIEGRKIETKLPEIMPKGVIMKVNNRGAEKLFIDIAASTEDFLDSLFLVGHVRGQIFCFYEEIEPNVPIVITKNTIPTGITHFTLFDKKLTPLAERLIFNEAGLDQFSIKVEEVKQAYQTREKIQLDLMLVDSLQTNTTANLSVSVTDKSLVKYPSNSQNIQQYLLLNSDLTEPIPNLNYYLENMDNSKRYWLDLAMMTYGWRKFDWKNLEQPNQNQEKYFVETGFSIQGYTTKKGEKDKRIPTEVMLSSLSNDFIYETVNTDESGNFIFKNLPYLDSLNFILQARIPTKNKQKNQSGGAIQLEGNRLVDFHFQKRSKPDFISKNTPKIPLDSTFSLNKYLTHEQHSNHLDSVYNSIWQINFDEEVVVKAERVTKFRTGNSFNLDYADWIAPEKKGIYLINSLISNGRYELDFYQNKLYWIKRNERFPVSIQINGIGGDGEGSDPHRFLNLEADRIKSIYIYEKFISVTTRDIPRSLQIKLESGILNYAHPGYKKARTFYTPDYTQYAPIHDEPDLRTAIHWAPNVSINSTDASTISFYAADTPTTYEVRMEGITENGQPLFCVYEVMIRS